MPWGDGTGPAGMGPMTGRGLGYCAGYGAPGFYSSSRGWGYGPGPTPYPMYAGYPATPWFGRGRGRWFGRGRGRGFGWWGRRGPWW